VWASRLAEEPGAAFRYNKEAVNLRAAIVKAASGKPLQVIARVFTDREALFAAIEPAVGEDARSCTDATCCDNRPAAPRRPAAVVVDLDFPIPICCRCGL
jgi:hypothetical protein